MGEDAVVGNVAQLQFSKFAGKRPPTGSQEHNTTGLGTASRRPVGLTVDTTKNKFGHQAR